MTADAPERRRIAVIDGDRRVDVAVPLDETLGGVLRRAGVAFGPGHHLVDARSGREAALGVLAAELTDGDLYAVVDLRPLPRNRRRPADAHDVPPTDRGPLWWLLGALAVVVAALLGFSGGTPVAADGLARAGAAGGLGVSAALAAIVWAVRRHHDELGEAVVLLAPVLLAFAAGYLAVPPDLVRASHLGVASGMLAAALLALVVTIAARGRPLRNAAGTATVVLLALTVVWGGTLMLGADPTAAAAISAGAAPLALRALPALLLVVPEGYHIEYRHFMSNRWTVRGAIPASQPAVEPEFVSGTVGDAVARVATGSVLLSLVAVLSMPVALRAAATGDPVRLGGAIGLAATVVLALLLVPRRDAGAAVRWVPRLAAAAILVEATIALIVTLPGLVPALVATGCLVAGTVAAGTVVPIARGSSSLVWSRVADVVEAFSVALALPAGLLAADVLGVLRGMMAA